MTCHCCPLHPSWFTAWVPTTSSGAFLTSLDSRTRVSHYTQNNTRGKETENPAVKETVEDASWKAGDRTDKPQKGQFSNRTFQKSALQLCAKLRISVCVCLLVQHLHRQQRKQVCFHRWKATRPRAAHSTSDRPPLPRASAELCSDGANPHAAHACSRLGRWRGQRHCREAAIWEQGQERRSWQQLHSAK